MTSRVFWLLSYTVGLSLVLVHSSSSSSSSSSSGSSSSSSSGSTSNDELFLREAYRTIDQQQQQQREQQQYSPNGAENLLFLDLLRDAYRQQKQQQQQQVRSNPNMAMLDESEPPPPPPPPFQQQLRLPRAYNNGPMSAASSKPNNNQDYRGSNKAVAAKRTSTNSARQQQQHQQQKQEQQQQKQHQSKRKSKDLASPPAMMMPSIPAASHFVLRSTRGSRRYDVPQIGDATSAVSKLTIIATEILRPCTGVYTRIPRRIPLARRGAMSSFTYSRVGYILYDDARARYNMLAHNNNNNNNRGTQGDCIPKYINAPYVLILVHRKCKNSTTSDLSYVTQCVVSYTNDEPRLDFRVTYAVKEEPNDYTWLDAGSDYNFDSVNSCEVKNLKTFTVDKLSLPMPIDPTPNHRSCTMRKFHFAKYRHLHRAYDGVLDISLSCASFYYLDTSPLRCVFRPTFIHRSGLNYFQRVGSSEDAAKTHWIYVPRHKHRSRCCSIARHKTCIASVFYLSYKKQDKEKKCNTPIVHWSGLQLIETNSSYTKGQPYRHDAQPLFYIKSDIPGVLRLRDQCSPSCRGVTYQCARGYTIIIESLPTRYIHCILYCYTRCTRSQ
ncbi:unnamed protein product [Trichogramma brassicae]|uniref:Uncharacterized protein n=1 Tax=Trichogramma brassicae TaxID=86971 RepID=A0A6H5IT58_9HYME|nr:unnamed protein product [Trichogramma brassicae]